MSYAGPSQNTSLKESSAISSLTVLIILLISCVVLLLLLNCIFLGYKIIVLFKKRKRQRTDSESTLLRSTLSTRETPEASDLHTCTSRGGKGGYVSVSAPVSARPVSSSLTSSKDRAAGGQTYRTMRPDGATGRDSESLRAPSTILATMSTTNSTKRADLPRRSHLYTKCPLNWRRAVPVVPHCSDSDTDRVNTVPPNSPIVNVLTPLSATNTRPMRRSSTMELQNETMGVYSHDKRFEYEHASSIPAENSCFVASVNSSTLGPGFDSDFGASAGISLRILSCDSDGFSNAIFNSALEWDYYDPTYVSQNNIPKHMYHLPTVTTKQYWV